jgi:hypothetical protein
MGGHDNTWLWLRINLGDENLPVLGSIPCYIRGSKQQSEIIKVAKNMENHLVHLTDKNSVLLNGLIKVGLFN